MYHLLEESDRIQSVNAALRLLSDGGTIFISFISLYVGISYAMKRTPSLILKQSEDDYIKCYLKNETYCGDSFTKACFIPPCEILPFMSKFPLETLHLFGQESITAPREDIILAQPDEVINKWIELGIATCERKEFLSFAEHLMYVGKKMSCKNY